MGSAIARSAKEPDDIAPTIATISIAVSLGCAALLALTAPWLSSLLGQPSATQPLRILSICVALTGFFAVPGAQLVREFRHLGGCERTAAGSRLRDRFCQRHPERRPVVHDVVGDDGYCAPEGVHDTGEEVRK